MIFYRACLLGAAICGLVLLAYPILAVVITIKASM